jgi:putative chitinase
VTPKADNTGHSVLSNNPQNEITLLKTAKASGMKGTELAQFMAQTKHESWDFDRLKEKPQPGVKGYFSKKYDPKFAPRTAKILGNKHVGDGERYHGRGFIQLTGRDNYRMASDALGIDLLNKPELAARPDVAAKVAVWYWNTRVKPHVQNFNDTRAVTQKINPAAKGLENRHENFKDYMRII